MKFTYPSLLIFLVVFQSLLVQADEVMQNEIKSLFEEAGEVGTFVLADEKGATIFTHNQKRAEQQFSPASTFKVINTLVALNAGIVTPEESTFEWDGEKRWLDSWNQDQTLASAFKVSCVWCYQKMARQIGPEQYLSELQKLNFGNQQIGETIDQFWLDSSLEISAMEQAAFINKLISNKLHYKKEHVEIVKSIMFEETYGDTRLYGKTGWAVGDVNIGWYVGFVEAKDSSFSFAMNMELLDVNKAPLRKKVTIQTLKKLGVLEKKTYVSSGFVSLDIE